MTNSDQYQYQFEQDRLGLRIAAHLSDAADQLPYEISERLRVARERALGRQKFAPRSITSNLSVRNGDATLSIGSEPLGYWGRVAAALPLVTLVLGLIVIYHVQNDRRAHELAEIDAALLTDDLPPAAYTDPGFTQFLKLRADQHQ